jgi:hypothetical protein
MMAWFFLDLSPWKENDENKPEGVVSGKKDAEQSGCEPDGVSQTGQRF